MRPVDVAFARHFVNRKIAGIGRKNTGNTRQLSYR